ncbi:MAG: hypothetical protein M1368_06815 [Thaumarchaeota archaeon]|nr:hypothetical protein [Nitrososphaerota archaeon]
MRRQAIIAVVLFTAAILFVLVPLYTITLSYARPLIWPYPLGDPIFFGGILVIANCPLMAVFGRRARNGDSTKRSLFKIGVVGILIGAGLMSFALGNFALTLDNLIYFSIALFLIGLVGFLLIPPRYTIKL